VTLFTTAKTLVGGVSGTSLHWSVARRTLAWRLLVALLLILLVLRALLKLVALGVLTTIPL